MYAMESAPKPREAVLRALTRERPRLLALVRRGAGAADAEDVLQAASERALARCDQMRDPDRAEAWVARIVRNVLIDELRKRKDIALPSAELELSPEPAKAVDCGCVLVQAEQLRPEYAEILRRVVLEGEPVVKVASELGLTANNAHVRLHRARVALRERLTAHCGTTSVLGCSDCGCEERGCCPPQTR